MKASVLFEQGKPLSVERACSEKETSRRAAARRSSSARRAASRRSNCAVDSGGTVKWKRARRSPSAITSSSRGRPPADAATTA